MGIELIEGPDGWRLNLSAVVGLAEAQALALAARATVARGVGDVVVGLEQVAAVDTSAIQILLCLRRALAATGRTLRLEMAPPALTERWRRAGLYNELVRSGDQAHQR